MRKKRCELGNKKLMNAQAARLAEQGKLQVKGKDHHKSSTLRHMVTLCSNGKDNILRKWSLFKKLFLDSGRHINKKQNMFELQFT